MSSHSQTKTFYLKIWRQRSRHEDGFFEDHTVIEISDDMTFLEMLDMLNMGLSKQGQEPVVFDHDCREGICGTCSLVINGNPHGPLASTTACQLTMRYFEDNATIYVEPFRAKAFPVVKDLAVDRSSFDRIISAGGYVSTHVGSAPEANSILVPKENADLSFEAATCIGCGACVAACRNGSAMLFLSAKTSHLGLLPQGQTEHIERVTKMVHQMDEEDFGSCSNAGSCAGACPKNIDLGNMARLNRDYMKAIFKKRKNDE